MRCVTTSAATRELDRARLLASHAMTCLLRSTICGAVLHLGLVSALLGTVPAHAQIILDPSEELKRQQEREREQRDLLEAKPDIRLPGVPASAQGRLPPNETPCFRMDRVIFTTATSESGKTFASGEHQALNDALAGDDGTDSPLGKCLGTQGIALLIARAQDALISRGYVTSRILAPPQDLRQGTLTLTVIPGRIGRIHLTQTEGQRIALWNTMAAKQGELLNLRDLEQSLENLKRAPSSDADIRIEPGEGPDQSNLIISYQQTTPVRLMLSGDDSGSKVTGKYQGSATVSLDNLLGLNDLFYATLNRDLGGGDPGPRGTRGHVVHYDMPLGYWSFAVTSSAGRYYQSVAGAFQTYIYSGTSANTEIGISHIVYRDAVRKTSLGVKAFQRRSNNYIDDTEVMVQRRIVGGWELTLGHKDALKDARLDGTLRYKRGTDDFGTLPAPEEAFGEGTSRFGLVMLELRLDLPFNLWSQSLGYSSTLRAQKNFTPLTPQDRFSIGNRYTVRGFDGETTLSAERGWLLRNELTASLGQSAQLVYAGLDYGEVSGPSSDLLAGRTLIGAALGLRGRYPHLHYDIFAGAPLYKPESFKTASSTAGFNVHFFW